MQLANYLKLMRHAISAGDNNNVTDVNVAKTSFAYPTSMRNARFADGTFHNTNYSDAFNMFSVIGSDMYCNDVLVETPTK